MKYAALISVLSRNNKSTILIYFFYHRSKLFNQWVVPIIFLIFIFKKLFYEFRIPSVVYKFRFDDLAIILSLTNQ